MYDISKYLENKFNVIFNEKVRTLINNKCCIKKFPSKHIIVFEGEKTSNLYFIIDGLVRGYYTDKDGNDITKCFSSENDFFI